MLHKLTFEAAPDDRVIRRMYFMHVMARSGAGGSAVRLCSFRPAA